MGDPFLYSHRHSSRVFTLANRTPLSIRDQLVRAHYVCDRLLGSPLLAPGADLLIVGAGAAGSTIAVLAARAGVNTVLIDASRSAFKLQRSCTSRWVDPVQYDWPLSHCDQARWPVWGPPHGVPFGFQADRADQVAKGWVNMLNIERARPTLNVEFNTRLTRMPTLNTSATLLNAETWNTVSGVKLRRPFSVVVLAVGMSSERTDVPFGVSPGSNTVRFIGTPFWEPDTLERPDLGLTQAGNVIISGAGDGGLQDFIRATTGQRSALELLGAMFSAAGIGPQQQWVMLRQLHEAEHHVERSLPWSGARVHDHVLLKRLHGIHKIWIQDFAAHSPHAWQAMCAYLDRLAMGRRAADVVLYHPCDHFDTCYPLNRFVALLVDTWLKDRHGSSVGIQANGRLVGVSPSSSVTAMGKSVSPIARWNHPFEAHIAHAPQCHSPGHVGMQKVQAVGIVVRHGIKKHTQALWRRHLLPHHLP